MMGGKSREVLQFELPPHTTEWYYTVTTSAGSTNTQTDGLSGQLLNMLMPGLGLSSNVLSSIVVPPGSGACDIFLMTDANDVNKFVARQPYHYIAKYSRENFLSGAVQIKDLSLGTYFLTMRNPSSMRALQVTIEVSAIVKERSEDIVTPMH